jgi:hypothetical protein
VYHGNSKHLPVGCAPDVSSAPDFRGFDVGGDSMGDTDRGVGIEGADTGDADEGDDIVGASTGRKWHRPSSGCTHSGGVNRYWHVAGC